MPFIFVMLLDENDVFGQNAFAMKNFWTANAFATYLVHADVFDDIFNVVCQLYLHVCLQQLDVRETKLFLTFLDAA